MGQLKGGGGFEAVEPQVGFAFAGIVPMAGEAIVGKDGPDVAVELEGGRRGRRSCASRPGQ